MKRLIVLTVVFSVLAAARVHSAELTDSTSVLARAHELTPFVSQNSSGPLWTAFNANMRAAMQDSLNFARTLDAIHVTVGAVENVIR